VIAFRKGTTCRALVIGPLAFKFARGERGRRSNLYEARLYGTEHLSGLILPLARRDDHELIIGQRPL
jgi:hypothetical protein